jgi:hypothetical protein
MEDVDIMDNQEKILKVIDDETIINYYQRCIEAVKKGELEAIRIKFIPKKRPECFFETIYPGDESDFFTDSFIKFLEKIITDLKVDIMDKV